MDFTNGSYDAELDFEVGALGVVAVNSTVRLRGDIVPHQV